MITFTVGALFGASLVYIATNPTLRTKLSSLISGWMGKGA